MNIKKLINEKNRAEDASTIMGLTLVGKFGASAAFAIVYVYAGEIFPTDYRGIAVGSCSMFARVGGLFAPFIVEVVSWRNV